MSLSKRIKNWCLFITPDGAVMCNALKCDNPYFIKEFNIVGHISFDIFKIALIQHIRKYHS